MQVFCSAKQELDELPDGVLAQQTLEGNERAFEVLAKRYSSYLFCFIQRILGDYDRSCDVHQQVLVHLYKSLGTLKQDKPFKAWLFRVAHNGCIDMIRRQHTLPFSDFEKSEGDGENELTAIVDGHPQPERCAEQGDLEGFLFQAIISLPQHYRQIVWLRYQSQLTFSEIGQALAIPPSTAKTYFHRARPILRERLAAQHGFDLLPD